jgi:serine/threonine protein kinase
MNNYSLAEEVYRGNRTAVYRAREKRTINYVAFKSFRKDEEKRANAEFQAYQQLRGVPHILEFVTYYASRNHIWMGLQYCSGGDLRRIVHDDTAFPIEAIKSICSQIVSGLYGIHSRGFSYNNLNPAHVLFGEDGTCRLIDLSRLTKFESPKTDFKGLLSLIGYLHAGEALQNDEILNSSMPEDLKSLCRILNSEEASWEKILTSSFWNGSLKDVQKSNSTCSTSLDHVESMCGISNDVTVFIDEDSSIRRNASKITVSRSTLGETLASVRSKFVSPTACKAHCLIKIMHSSREPVTSERILSLLSSVHTTGTIFEHVASSARLFSDDLLGKYELTSFLEKFLGSSNSSALKVRACSLVATLVCFYRNLNPFPANLIRVLKTVGLPESDAVLGELLCKLSAFNEQLSIAEHILSRLEFSTDLQVFNINMKAIANFCLSFPNLGFRFFGSILNNAMVLQRGQFFPIFVLASVSGEKTEKSELLRNFKFTLDRLSRLSQDDEDLPYVLAWAYKQLVTCSTSIFIEESAVELFASFIPSRNLVVASSAIFCLTEILPLVGLRHLNIVSDQITNRIRDTDFDESVAHLRSVVTCIGLKRVEDNAAIDEILANSLFASPFLAHENFMSVWKVSHKSEVSMCALAEALRANRHVSLKDLSQVCQRLLDFVIEGSSMAPRLLLCFCSIALLLLDDDDSRGEIKLILSESFQGEIRSANLTIWGETVTHMLYTVFRDAGIESCMRDIVIHSERHVGKVGNLAIVHDYAQYASSKNQKYTGLRKREVFTNILEVICKSGQDSNETECALKLIVLGLLDNVDRFQCRELRATLIKVGLNSKAIQAALKDIHDQRIILSEITRNECKEIIEILHSGDSNTTRGTLQLLQVCAGIDESQREFVARAVERAANRFQSSIEIYGIARKLAKTIKL